MDLSWFNTITWIWIGIGVLVLPLTLLITAPFGRHYSPKYGPAIGNRKGWIVMESPAIWWFTIVFLLGLFARDDAAQSVAAWVLWLMWMVHYVNRGLIFPFRIRTSGKLIPVMIVLFAFCFQMVNGYLNGVALGWFGARYQVDWLSRPNFLIGLVCFVAGWGINIWSDEVLLKLRQPAETNYQVPQGGLYRWISCPNFFGEIVLWSGWAIMCWNLAALSFAIWTVSNLVPRALAHHRWYRISFPDYPAERKAIFPGIL